jgi:hypothetical protein
MKASPPAAARRQVDMQRRNGFFPADSGVVSTAPTRSFFRRARYAFQPGQALENEPKQGWTDPALLLCMNEAWPRYGLHTDRLSLSWLTTPLFLDGPLTRQCTPTETGTATRSRYPWSPACIARHRNWPIVYRTHQNPGLRVYSVILLSSR